MGCFLSTDQKNGQKAPNFEQGAPTFTGGIVDSDPPPAHALKSNSSTWQMAHIGQAPHDENVPAPSYEELTWLNRVLKAFRDVQAILARYNISYQDLVHTETHLVVDDYYRYTEKEKAGIAIMTGAFQGLLRAVEAWAVITFMT